MSAAIYRNMKPPDMLVDGPTISTIEDDGGSDLSPSLEALHVHVKEQRFHLRTLDITISETQNQLLLVDEPDGGVGVGGASYGDDHDAGDSAVAGLSPSKNTLSESHADALDQHRWTTRQLLEQQRREKRAELQERLRHSLNRRGELLLELQSTEVELELLLLRRYLAERRGAAGESMLLPRCVHCFHQGPNAAGSQPSVANDHTGRQDSLMAPDIMLMPAPLAFAKTLEPRNGETAVRARIGPGREHRIQDAAPMHRSLKGLVKMLKHRKPSVSRLATTL